MKGWTRVAVVLAAAGLAIDAGVHIDVAGDYALVRTSLVSQADLFRLEAVAALVAAAVLVLRPTRASALLALLVSAGGVAAVLFYTYVDPGAIGPMPDMYEPVWYPAKSLSLVGELVATAASAALLAGARGARRSRSAQWTAERRTTPTR